MRTAYGTSASSRSRPRRDTEWKTLGVVVARCCLPQNRVPSCHAVESCNRCGVQGRKSWLAKSLLRMCRYSWCSDSLGSWQPKVTYTEFGTKAEVKFDQAVAGCFGSHLDLKRHLALFMGGAVSAFSLGVALCRPRTGIEKQADLGRH